MGSLTFNAEKRLFYFPEWNWSPLQRYDVSASFVHLTFQPPSCLKFTSTGLSNFKLNYSFPTELFAWQSSEIKQDKKWSIKHQNILWGRSVNDSIFLSAAAKIHLSKTEWQNCLHFVRYWQQSLSSLYMNEKNAQSWSSCSEKKKAGMLVKFLYSKYLIRVEWGVIPLTYQ